MLDSGKLPDSVVTSGMFSESLVLSDKISGPLVDSDKFSESLVLSSKFSDLLVDSGKSPDLLGDSAKFSSLQSISGILVGKAIMLGLGGRGGDRKFCCLLDCFAESLKYKISDAFSNLSNIF